MKRTVYLLAVCSTTFSSSAQLFSNESVGGAVLGGLIGGIIGHNSGRRTAEGMGIGAGVGLVLGALAGESRRRETYYSSTYVSEVPTTYVVSERRPNYAVSGTILGGVAGGIIGHNNGRKTAEGVAIGAASGLFLGAAAEQGARRSESLIITSSPATVAVLGTATITSSEAQPSPSEAPPKAGPAQLFGATPPSANMNSANALFGR